MFAGKILYYVYCNNVMEMKVDKLLKFLKVRVSKLILSFIKLIMKFVSYIY